MTSPDPIPEWCKPGEKVASVSSSGATVVTVKSVGKRYVMTENGGKYDLTRRLESRSGGTWGTTYRLLPLSQPSVQALFKEQRRKADAAADLRAALADWNENGDDCYQCNSDVRVAARALLDALPERDSRHVALREAAVEWRKFIPCPTCEDPMSRETTGMVCQTCGNDYMDGDQT